MKTKSLKVSLSLLVIVMSVHIIVRLIDLFFPNMFIENKFQLIIGWQG